MPNHQLVMNLFLQQFIVFTGFRQLATDRGSFFFFSCSGDMFVRKQV